MWGPCLRTTINRIWPTTKERLKETEEYRKHGTFLAPDFYETFPAIEDLIQGVRCHLRLVRGSEDEFNTKEELDSLADAHRGAQPAYAREVMEIVGLKHSVVQDAVSSELHAHYLATLFDQNIAYV